ncbi:MAG TPA: Dna2/Cas4 domain-containing protein [Anaerolineales bacterium]
MLWLALVLAILGAILLMLSSRQRRATGLPGGQVIYTDTNEWETVKQPLFDATLGLTGKPDYLVRQGDLLIPVEVKSKQIGGAPYDSHVYQLAAYCLLVHRVFGQRPKHGILHYPNRTFSIDFTPELESAVINIILEMQSQSGRKGPDRSHDTPARCARCGFRMVCDQSLD